MYAFTRRCDGTPVKFMLGGDSWEPVPYSRLMLVLLCSYSGLLRYIHLAARLYQVMVCGLCLFGIRDSEPLWLLS